MRERDIREHCLAAHSTMRRKKEYSHCVPFVSEKVTEKDGARGMVVPPLYSYSYNKTKPEASFCYALSRGNLILTYRCG